MTAGEKNQSTRSTQAPTFIDSYSALCLDIAAALRQELQRMAPVIDSESTHKEWRDYPQNMLEDTIRWLEKAAASHVKRLEVGASWAAGVDTRLIASNTVLLEQMGQPFDADIHASDPDGLLKKS